MDFIDLPTGGNWYCFVLGVVAGCVLTMLALASYAWLVPA